VEIRKGKAVGGTGGDPFDDTAANPNGLPIIGLNIVTNRNPADTNQVIIGTLQAQWSDGYGPLHGGKGPLAQPSSPIRFADSERIVRAEVKAMFYNFPNVPAPPHWIAGLQIVTTAKTYTFGDMTGGPTMRCIPAAGESLIGFFGRSGSYIDQVGCVFGRPK
jgi:hypothetical protein